MSSSLLSAPTTMVVVVVSPCLGALEQRVPVVLVTRSSAHRFSDPSALSPPLSLSHVIRVVGLYTCAQCRPPPRSCLWATRVRTCIARMCWCLPFVPLPLPSPCNLSGEVIFSPCGCVLRRACSQTLPLLPVPFRPPAPFHHPFQAHPLRHPSSLPSPKMRPPCIFAARCGAQRISRLATAAAATVSSSPAIMRCAMSSSSSTSSSGLLTVRASAAAMHALHSGSLSVSSTLPTSLTALRTMRGAATIVVPVRASFFAGAAVSPMATACSSLFAAQRCYGVARATRLARSPKKSSEGSGQLQGVNNLERYKGEEEEEQKDGGGNEQENPFNMNSGPGYLPFPPPFHTINIVMILFLANVMCYLIMNLGSDDWRDFVVEHCTLSHENWTRIYPLFTNAFYQENILQLLIDCWLLWQFGDTMLGFLGNTRMAFFALLCTLGGSVIHVARQKFELYYGMDELEVRGRCYGPNPFIMGLVAIEGLIFRHLNFIQQPPIPFLVLTAFVMVIDVWRIFTTKPEEHGAATGGALMAYLFWALPTRMLGLDKLTATL